MDQPCPAAGSGLGRRGQFAREALAGLDTIADLAGTETAGEAHVAEAVSCRALDRHDAPAA